MFSKYIIITTESRGIPIVFPDYITHISIAKSLEKTIGVTTSAGFCYLDQEGVYHCYGRSDTLNLDGRPIEDSYILNNTLL